MQLECPTCKLKFKKVHSKCSQIFFWNVYSQLDKEIQKCTYFDELNKELKFPSINGYYKLDFCILNNERKYLLEYYGIHWHAHPDYHNWDDIIYEDKLACDIWTYDTDRKNYLEKCGFYYDIVWEDNEDVNRILTNINDYM